MERETTESSFAPGCEPVVSEKEHQRLLWLMTEYFRTLGYTDVKARLPGFEAPPVLTGTIEDCRPDFTCRQTDRAHTPLIAEVVTAGELENPKLDNRWSLLFSAARLYGAEMHFVIPKWHPKLAVDATLKKRLGRMELNPHHIWRV